MPSVISRDSSAIYQTARNSIQYAEFPHPSRQWANDGCMITRRLGCLLSDEDQFIKDMLGEDTYVSGSHRFNRYLPQEDAEWEGFYCDALTNPQFLGQFRGSEDGNWATYVDASELIGGDPTDGIVVYDATFRAPLYDLYSDQEIDSEQDLGSELFRFVINMSQDTVEALPVPTGFANFLPIVSVGQPIKPVGAQYSMLFPQESIILRWVRIPLVGYPKNTFASTIGKVNSGPFVTPGSAGKIYAKDELLLMAPNKRLYQGNNGQTYLDVDVIMQSRPAAQSWNKAPTADGTFVGTWRSDNEAAGIYERADFNKLFDPANG